MEIRVQVPEYDKSTGLADAAVDGHELMVTVENGEVLITGNSAGLLWLATNLIALSQESTPAGFHQHYGQDYGLVEGSTDLIIGKS